MPRTADLADDGDDEPKEPDNGGNDNVGDLDGEGRVGEAQTKTTIDDADCDTDAAVPQVHVGPKCAAAELFEAGVVDEAEDGLEEEGDEGDDAHDGVDVGAGVGELSRR